MVEPPSEKSILPNNKWSFNEAVKWIKWTYSYGFLMFWRRVSKVGKKWIKQQNIVKCFRVFLLNDVCENRLIYGCLPSKLFMQILGIASNFSSIIK